MKNDYVPNIERLCILRGCLTRTPTMSEKINGYTFAEVAEALGHDLPNLSDFTPGEYMKPTAVGLQRCQSADHARSLHELVKQIEEGKLRGNGPADLSCYLLAFTACVLCGDEERRFDMTNDDMLYFINANAHRLSRLVLPAMTLRYPDLLAEMFGTTV